MPVVFDNFVWFQDADLAAAIKAAIPSFDGTAPANDRLFAYVSRLLQQLIDRRQISGQVLERSTLDLTTKARRISFRVATTDGSLRLCALRLQGNSAVPEPVLLESARKAIGSDYSRVVIDDMVQGTLHDLYRARGYWRATFGVPVATAGAPGCAGVTVTLPVTEGLQYTWGAISWIGNSAIPAARLDAAVALKAGRVADAGVLDAGLRLVHDEYSALGYLQESTAPQARPDDGSKTVSFEITVTEGPQFHMGTVEFVGFSAGDAAALAKRWRLEPGDPFDPAALTRFRSEALSPGFGPVAAETNVNAATAIVDIRFVRKKK